MKRTYPKLKRTLSDLLERAPRSSEEATEEQAKNTGIMSDDRRRQAKYRNVGTNRRMEIRFMTSGNTNTAR